MTNYYQKFKAAGEQILLARHEKQEQERSRFFKVTCKTCGTVQPETNKITTPCQCGSLEFKTEVKDDGL